MKYRVEGDGPLLVSLPGLDGTGELFYKQIPGLTPRYRVAVVALPDDQNSTYNDIAAGVAGVIRELGDQRVVVVGESFGGTVALWFALLYPAHVDLLVILNLFSSFI